MICRSQNSKTLFTRVRGSVETQKNYLLELDPEPRNVICRSRSSETLFTGAGDGAQKNYLPEPDLSQENLSRSWSRSEVRAAPVSGQSILNENLYTLNPAVISRFVKT